MPVLVSDIATVAVGDLPRLGIAGHDEDDDVVLAIVLMRRGAQTLPTLRRGGGGRRINACGLLPPGVQIERSTTAACLVNITTRTVLHNMMRAWRSSSSSSGCSSATSAAR